MFRSNAQSNQRHNGNGRNQNGNGNHNNNRFQQGGNSKGHQSPPVRITTPIPIMRAIEAPSILEAPVSVINDDYGSSNNHNEYENDDYGSSNNYNEYENDNYGSSNNHNEYQSGDYGSSTNTVSYTHLTLPTNREV